MLSGMHPLAAATTSQTSDSVIDSSSPVSSSSVFLQGQNTFISSSRRIRVQSSGQPLGPAFSLLIQEALVPPSSKTLDIEVSGSCPKVSPNPKRTPNSISTSASLRFQGTLSFLLSFLLSFSFLLLFSSSFLLVFCEKELAPVSGGPRPLSLPEMVI